VKKLTSYRGAIKEDQKRMLKTFEMAVLRKIGYME